MEELHSLNLLIEHLKRLPSVGQKSAERMAYAMLSFDNEVLKDFGESIKLLREKIHVCTRCGLYTEHELCSICTNPERTSDTLVVVAYPKDVAGFAKLDDYQGRYHILGGILSPSQNMSADKLDLGKLISRVKNEYVKELVIATNPTVEGELTALYIAKKLKAIPVKITRLAYGLPMGGQVDYVDSLTLFKALEGRKEIS